MTTWFTGYDFLTWPYEVEPLLKKNLCKFGSYNFISHFVWFFIDVIYTENDYGLYIWQVVIADRQFGFTPMVY